uniref:sulfocyanin-like copper-binding protein n=1 Tax=Nonomuraea pusilla TaxID=46177 RepID=UPI001F47868C|nr:sulfocyanin-like copper-binding protein [Nonomuraea pusilla]
MAAASLVALAGLGMGGPAAASTTAPHRQPSPACTAPPLQGQVVDVTTADMGPGMMGPGPYPGTPGPGGPMPGTPGPYGQWPHGMRMTLRATPQAVPAGKVSLRVVNDGVYTHEVVVLPLQPGQTPGRRVTNPDGRVSEAGSLGEASRTCGAGAGSGIAPGSTGWTTLTLRPGRYELVCNFPGHYAAGMYAELDVTR